MLKDPTDFDVLKEMLDRAGIEYDTIGRWKILIPYGLEDLSYWSFDFGGATGRLRGTTVWQAV